MSGVRIKSASEIEMMRATCRLAALVLAETGKKVKAGVSTLELDEFAHDFITSKGATPSPLGYRGFPRSICASVNEVVCHGIPGRRKLKEGDIINLDITTNLEGFHGDTSATFFCGEPRPEAVHVAAVSARCLRIGIEQVRPGARLFDIGAAIQEYAESENCSVVRDYVGHGVGREFHEAPQVPHYGERGRGIRLKRGMIFTIEPMINNGDWRVRVLKDGWTAVTADGSLSAQFEHTILVTDDGVDVLTAQPGPLANSINA